MDKQSNIVKHVSEMQQVMAHQQQMHIQKLEQMILQLRQEMITQKLMNQKQEK
jgi:hypothetical protein